MKSKQKIQNRLTYQRKRFIKGENTRPNTKTKKQPPEVFYKKVFLKIPQNLRENISARVSFLIKLQASGYTSEKKLYST